MSKVAVIGAVVVIGLGVVGGGGYYYASQQAEKKFQQKIELIKNTFPGVTITYANHNIGIFSQEATMDKVVIKYKDGEVYTADKVSAVMGSDDDIKNLKIDQLAVKEKETATEQLFTVEHTEIANAKADAGWIVIESGKIKKIVPSKISFGLLNFQNLEFKPDTNTNIKVAQYQIKNYGLSQKSDMLLNNLSATGRSDFSIKSFKIDQVNLADISKRQEAFFADRKNYRSSEALNKGLLQNLSMMQFGLLNIEDLQFKDKYGPAFQIAHYHTKDYGLDKKTDILLQNLTVKDSRQNLSIGSFKIDQINLANMLKIQSEFVANENDRKSINDKAKEIFQLLSKMQFSLLSIDKVIVEEYKSAFKLAHYQMKDYGVDRKTSQSLKDFSVVIPYFSKIVVSLASFESSGVDAATFIGMLESIDLNNLDNFGKNYTNILQDYAKKVGGIVNTGSVSGLKISFGKEFISLGTLTTKSDMTKEGNSSETYALDGLEFSVPDVSGSDLLNALKQMGYRQVSVSGRLTMQYQMSTNFLSVSLKELTFKDIGAISATLQANAPLSISYDSPETILTNPEVKLKELSVVMQNNGVVERLLKSASQEQGTTEAEVKESIIASVKEVAQKDKDIPASFTEDLVKTLKAFLQNPQVTKIKLSSMPTSPISGAVLDDKSSEEQFNLLNIKIQAVPIKH
ncbi:unnamed protein product [Commensalibacter communis]|uniref:hypothetical protein n=1 Tax=Commensalibacter communis TaxID=2972786 RepID=UPI0022FF782A|nr:hypothetical protein [Commensalibacter communis]CAI3944977.1 unnamed protein product [Commensalibacter communis]